MSSFDKPAMWDRSSDPIVLLSSSSVSWSFSFSEMEARLAAPCWTTLALGPAPPSESVSVLLGEVDFALSAAVEEDLLRSSPRDPALLSLRSISTRVSAAFALGLPGACDSGFLAGEPGAMAEASD